MVIPKCRLQALHPAFFEPWVRLSRLAKLALGCRGFEIASFNAGSGAGPTAKQEKVCPIQLFLKVAAPWGRGDFSTAASGYSISGFAIAGSQIFFNLSAVA